MWLDWFTRHTRLEPPPGPQQFEQTVDYLVHTERDGTRTELLRVHVDIDDNHRLCGTWPINELRLEHGHDCA